MIYVVLGMHKSGTTLVAQTLHAAGINMGDFDESLTYDTNNKYERHDTQELNRDLLHGYLMPPMDYLLRKPFRSNYDQAGYRRNKDSIALIRSGALQNRLQTQPPPLAMTDLISRHTQTYANWGFKDPRTCLTYPVWQAALPEHKVIIVFRHYRELMRRYKTASSKTRLFRVLHAWTMHNWFNLRYIDAAQTPTFVVRYEALMQDDEVFMRLEKFVGMPLPDQRNPSLYRNRAQATTPPPLPHWLTRQLPVQPENLYQTLVQKSANHD